MNIKQMKRAISAFRTADVSIIKDDAMRAKAQKLQAKQQGFTLLELLVVVAIIAIIAGAVISAMDGKEERAAQSVTVHTMATLESGMKVYKVTEKRLLPGNLESLLCTAGVVADASGGLAATGTIDDGNSYPLSNGTFASNSNSNVSRVDGGLTDDLVGKLTVIDIDNDGDLLENVINSGLTNLRYLPADLCAGTFSFPVGSFDGQTSAVAAGNIVDIVKPNLIFRSPYGEDNEWEYGAGIAVTLDASSAGFPMAFYNEPGDIGLEEEDIVAVFGIGPDSSLIGEIIGKAPSDGNVGPDKYGHFSVAVKLGTCQEDDAGVDELKLDLDGGVIANCDLEQDIEIVGIIDGGGDGYDDEIAEARGNQEE